MPTASVSVTCSMAGLTASQSETLTEDGVVGLNPTAAAADAGELTTRSSASAGVITVTSTDLVTGNEGVLTWEDASGNLKHRYNVALTVAGTEITISGGAGDDLPAQDSDINIGLQVQANGTFDFDDVEVFCVHANVRGVIAFMDGTDTEKLVMDMDASKIALWKRDSGFPEPMTGTPVTYALFGSGSTTTAFTPKVLALYDSTDPFGSGQ